MRRIDGLVIWFRGYRTKMKSTFEIENVNWLAVVLISAFVFIFGFVFWNEWMGVGMVIVSICATAFVTGRSRGRARIIIDMPKREPVIIERKQIK